MIVNRYYRENDLSTVTESSITRLILYLKPEYIALLKEKQDYEDSNSK